MITKSLELYPNPHSSAYITRFLQPDSLVPSVGNPQSWNRYAYVANSPITHNDPTGHKPCWATSRYSCNLGKKEIDDLLNSEDENGQNFIYNLLEQSGQLSDYIGPIHKDVQDILIAQGADPALLGTVTIYLKQDSEWDIRCASGHASAKTSSDYVIYFCNQSRYDPTKPTPILLHELVHVKQWRDYPHEITAEIEWWGQLERRDKAVEWWNNNWPSKVFGTINWSPYDRYSNSWIERQAVKCQNAFTANLTIPLDTEICNLGP